LERLAGEVAQEYLDKRDRDCLNLTTTSRLLLPLIFSTHFFRFIRRPAPIHPQMIPVFVSAFLQLNQNRSETPLRLKTRFYRSYRLAQSS
jgi:hypothetical protein